MSKDELLKHLVALIVSMCGYWLVFAKDLPTRSEVSGMIQKEAPYTHDRRLIEEAIKRHTTVIEELRGTMIDLKVAIEKK